MVLAGSLAGVPCLATSSLSPLGPQGEPKAAASTAAQVPTTAEAPEVVRSMLVHGGRIHLNDGKGTVMDSLLIRDGLVVASGSYEELIKKPASDTWSRLDLHGATAVPGLQDAHGHLEAYGERLEAFDLSGCADYDELIDRVLARVDTIERDAWIIGRGWDAETWKDTTPPHHKRLSEAVPDNPVFLTSADGHAAFVNRATLELLELDGHLDPPPRLQGGRVVRDQERYATGVLLDSAMNLVAEHLPEAQREDCMRYILAAQDAMLALGLTCVHDMDVSPKGLEALRELRARGELRLRVVAYLDGNDRLSSDMLDGLPEFDSAGRLSIVGVSLRVDGSLNSRGAAMIEEYTDAPGERGHTLLNKEDLARRVALIAGAGLQPAAQATGNHANRMVLDVYQELGDFIDGFRRLRPRIEHAEVVAPRDWPRFPALGVIPSLQPSSSDAKSGWIEDRLGPDRARDCAAWRRLAPELGQLAFGSNSPAVSPSPVLGLHAARMRQVEPERDLDPGTDSVLPYDQLDGASVLTGFTSGVAYAGHQDNRRGRLLADYAADLTVFDIDPVTCATEDLLEAQVLMTLIDGRVVYRAGP
jgi:hypothetical protein